MTNMRHVIWLPTHLSHVPCPISKPLRMPHFKNNDGSHFVIDRIDDSVRLINKLPQFFLEKNLFARVTKSAWEYSEIVYSTAEATHPFIGVQRRTISNIVERVVYILLRFRSDDDAIRSHSGRSIPRFAAISRRNYPTLTRPSPFLGLVEPTLNAFERCLLGARHRRSFSGSWPRFESQLPLHHLLVSTSGRPVFFSRRRCSLVFRWKSVSERISFNLIMVTSTGD